MLQRTLGVLLAALLLMPASLGQALPPVPTALPGLPPLLPAMPRHQPAAPAEVRDRGLEAIGGPLELRQRREAMLAAGAAAPMAVPPAQAPREELQRVTFMEPRPTAPRAQAAAGDSDAEPAAGAPKSDPVEVHTRAAAAPMAATAAGYALSLSADVFPAGAQVSTTATLTRSGLPVAGATLSLGTADLTFTTDGAGTAAIAFAAPGSNTELPVTVTTADGALTEAPLASLFVVAPGYGAVVVEDAVDPAGNPITAFSIQIHYGNGGVYANFTETGTRGAIIRAGDGWVEVRADLADAGFLHHQAITVTGGARTAVHPSGSGMVRLQLQPTLTFGAALTQAEFSLHPDNVGYTSRADSFDGTDVYLQPGYYELMLLARFGTERVLEERSILVAGGPTVPMAIAVNRNDLTTATFRGQNGSGPQPFGWVEIGSLWTQIRLTDLDQPLLVDRWGYGRPIRYGLELETETDWYRYTFDGDERYPRTTGSGLIEWILGAPLVSRLRHLNGYSAPGAILTYGTQLRTVHGDWVTVQRATKDPQSKLYGVFRDVPGTLRLKDGAGSTVTEAAIPTGWSETQVDLPADASGEYTAEAIYLPGPFHPEVVGVLSVPVYREPDYRLTLSKEIFQPGESGTVTAHLSVDGQPAAGATLQVGYGGSEGTFTTDTNGDATFTFTADWGGETPIDFTHNDHYGRPGYMYTVPEGYAVLIYTGATDQARAPLFDATVSFTTYSAAGGPYQRGAWVGRNSVFGAVRPAGVTDVELFSDYSPSGGSLYLHDRVTLTPGERREISLSGVGTQPLTWHASLDNWALGDQAMVRSDALTGPGVVNPGLRAPIYVAPGQYSVLVYDDVESALFTAEGVTVTGPTTFEMRRDSADLAALPNAATDGLGRPISPFPDVQVGQMRLNLRSNLTYRVTPDIPYKVWNYSLWVQSWQYFFSNRSGSPQVPTAGGTVDLGMGGPLQFAMQAPETVAAGAFFYASGRVQNAHGHEVRIYGPDCCTGTVTLRNATGDALATFDASPDYWYSELRAPTEPGTYTLEAEFDLGPYQGSTRAVKTITVQPAPEPLVITALTKVVTAGEQTAVTVRATRGGLPVAGQELILSGDERHVTDASGEAVFQVEQGYTDVLTVQTYDQLTQNWHGDVLYVLDGETAAVEVTATGADGAALKNFWAGVQSPGSSWSTYDVDGKVGLIAPAGPAITLLTKEGAPAYFMDQRLELTGGLLHPVRFDSRTAAAQTFTADLDGAPLADAWLALRPDGQLYRDYLSGLQLDSNGQGTAYLTPGDYIGLVQGTAGGAGLAVIRSLPGLSGGASHVTVSPADVGQVTLSATLGGTVRPADLTLYAELFQLHFAGTERLLLSPGTYYPQWLQLQAPQPEGPDWEYQLYARSVAPLTVVAGAAQSTRYNIDIASAEVEIQPLRYRSGQRLIVDLEILTSSGWRYAGTHEAGHWSTRVGPTSLTIHDAAGQTVHTDLFYGSGTSDFQVPADPSPAYTVTMSRDLGAAGTATASATATLAQPMELRVSHEVLLTGQTTQVTVTVLQGDLPLAGAAVRLSGPGTQAWHHTGSRGQVVIPITPKASGVYEIRMENPDPYGNALSAWLYALAPGDGLVDVLATDRSGQPLANYYFDLADPAVADTERVSGGTGHLPRIKVIVPAGTRRFAIRGSSPSDEQYYMTGEVQVPSQAQVTLQAGGAGTVPLRVELAGLTGPYYGDLMLRNKALGYTEWYPFPLGPGAKTYYVTPGTYELLAAAEQFGQLYLLPAANVTAPADGTGAVTLDAAQATATLRRAVTVPTNLGPAFYVDVTLASGRLLYTPWSYTAEIHAAPGTYRVWSGSFYLTHPLTGDRWYYRFDGGQPFTVAADTEKVIDLGGAVTVTLQAQAGALIGAAVPITAAFRNEMGMKLSSVYRLGTAGWEYVPSQLGVIGPSGYSTVVESPNGKFIWQAPPQPGTYPYKTWWDLGPYVGAPGASGSINLIRPARRP